MSKINLQEPQRNRNATANFVNLIRTSTVCTPPCVDREAWILTHLEKSINAYQSLQKTALQYWSLLNWQHLWLCCGCVAVPVNLLFDIISLNWITLYIVWTLERRRITRRLTRLQTIYNVLFSEKWWITSKSKFTGTATQPQCNRKFCQFDKDQFCIQSKKKLRFIE